MFIAVILCIMYVSKCVAMQLWFTSLTPAHRSPSHFALILQWLDKNTEQTSRGFRQEPSEPRSLVGPHCQDDVTTPACLPAGPNFHA